MKKTIIIVVALSLLVAGIAAATVVSSKHDMRGNVASKPGRTITSVGGQTTQVCVYCHHPHRGTLTGVSSVLLWNISDANQNFATYSSPTTNATGMGGQLGSNDAAQYTLLCMGCHDGGGGDANFVKASDAAGLTLGSMPNLGGNTSNLGTTLADDHPVDFDYPTAVGAGNGLTDIQLATGDEVNGAISTTNYPLYKGTMQCATCHDVHNGSQMGIQFMRGTVVNSEICRDCHTAK